MENKIETPLQRLIAEYERLQNDALTFQEKIFFNGVIAVAKTNLPYEREVIENACIQTTQHCYIAVMRYLNNPLKFTDEDLYNQKLEAQQYYNQTFQTNE